MSCYHPLLGQFYVDASTGERKVSISHLERYDFITKKVVKRDYNEIKSVDPDAFLVPCGKCIGCKMDYSRAWADRMMLELESNNGKAVFITLTYDDYHLVNKNGFSLDEKVDRGSFQCSLDGKLLYNDYGSLYKKHLQLFMKKLRKELDKQQIKVRFYAVGEYGSWEHSHRPHFHIVLFGLGLDDLSRKVPVGQNELGQKVFTCPLIFRCWNRGFVSVGDVSWRSCAYVARYVNKKVLDPGENYLIESAELNPLFSLMSRKPGIAKKYLEDHPGCLDYTSIYISDSDGSKKINIPKYFVNQLKLTDPQKADIIISQRAAYAQDHMMSKLSQTDLPLLDYLEVEEKKMLGRIKSLKRSI